MKGLYTARLVPAIACRIGRQSGLSIQVMGAACAARPHLADGAATPPGPTPPHLARLHARSRTARRTFWYLLSCALGLWLVRLLQTLEGLSLLWVIISAVRQRGGWGAPWPALRCMQRACGPGTGGD